LTEQLAHRDLRNRSAEILRDVAAGASYESTLRRGHRCRPSAPRRGLLRSRQCVLDGQQYV
jgi:hypothetical protein